MQGSPAVAPNGQTAQGAPREHRLMRIGPALAHQHREWLLRWASVQPELVAGCGRVRLSAPRHEAGADVQSCSVVPSRRVGALAELRIADEDPEVQDFIHERLRWMAFLAGWMTARPGELPDLAEIDRAYREWSGGS